MLHFILFHVLSLSLAFLQIYFQCLNLNLSMANNRLMSHLVNINLTSNLYSDIFFIKEIKTIALVVNLNLLYVQTFL